MPLEDEDITAIGLLQRSADSVSHESDGSESDLEDDEVLVSGEEDQVDESAFGKLIMSALEPCAPFHCKFHCELNFIERYCVKRNGLQEELRMRL